MTHNLTPSDQRCDGEIPNDAQAELCQRRDTCQRYIAHRCDDGSRLVACMIPVRNCNMHIKAQNLL